MYNLYSWYNDVMVKNIKTGKEYKTTISKQIIRKRNLKVGDHLNQEEIIIKIFGKVGVKKKLSKPYFETKVVKVKKKSNCCPTCGREAEKPKGNWVNGENLDKIKFPCFCKWSDNGWMGMLIKDWKNCEAVYTIVRIDRQTGKSETYGSFKSLKEFIEAYHVHILKGKIIIYEEE